LTSVIIHTFMIVLWTQIHLCKWTATNSI